MQYGWIAGVLSHPTAKQLQSIKKRELYVLFFKTGGDILEVVYLAREKGWGWQENNRAMLYLVYPSAPTILQYSSYCLKFLLLINLEKVSIKFVQSCLWHAHSNLSVPRKEWHIVFYCCHFLQDPQLF